MQSALSAGDQRRRARRAGVSGLMTALRSPAGRLARSAQTCCQHFVKVSASQNRTRFVKQDASTNAGRRLPRSRPGNHRESTILVWHRPCKGARQAPCARATPGPAACSIDCVDRRPPPPLVSGPRVRCSPRSAARQTSGGMRGRALLQRSTPALPSVEQDRNGA